MAPACSSPIFVLSLLLLVLGAVATQSEVSTPFFEEDVSHDNNQRLSPLDEAVQPKQNEETQAHAHPMPETIGVSPWSSWSSWLRTFFTNALGLPGFDINAHVADQPCSGSLIGSECLAWQDFFDATGGGGCLRDDPCACKNTVPGYYVLVTCQDGHITNMDLERSSISGSIPNSISALTALTNLQLSYTRLSGTIPDSISALTALNFLDLESKRISGSIPDSISALSPLIRLSLTDTSISGSIPQSFCNLDIEGCALSYNGSPAYACPLPSCTDKLKACGITSCK